MLMDALRTWNVGRYYGDQTPLAPNFQGILDPAAQGVVGTGQRAGRMAGPFLLGYENYDANARGNY